ncbi:hypothetical protein BDL97_15G013100 [Sphagnum fallax]|nr:hypothetical protein BDL97_15G013100 [Sphagnum fallax]
MVLQPLEGERIDELRNWLLFFFVAEGQRQDLRHWVLLLLLSFVAEAREKGFDALGDVCVLLRKERKRQDLTHWEWDRYTRSICWVRASTNAAHARHMRQIMLTSFPSHLMGVMGECMPEAQGESYAQNWPSCRSRHLLQLLPADTGMEI